MEEQEKIETIVVNLFGGPGTAKSIFCALIFAKMKLNNVNSEMAREFIKNEIWKGDTYMLSNQHAIYSEQQKLVHMLNGKVKVVVTDAPLMNSVLYDNMYSNDIDVDFHRVVKNEFGRYNNRNYVLKRVMPYEQEGRYQTEEGALEVDKSIVKLLDDSGIKYQEFDAWPENADVIARQILEDIKL